MRRPQSLIGFSSLWLAAALTPIVGCLSSDRDPRMQAFVGVEAGHTHTAAITYRDIRSGLRTFPLLEAYGHSHSFELFDLRGDIGNLDLGLPVAVTSSYTNGHTHSILLQKLDPN